MTSINKIPSKINWVLISGFLLLGAIFLVFYLSLISLRTTHYTTSGLIKGYSSGYRGGLLIDYVYTVDGKEIKHSLVYGNLYVSEGVHFLNKSFPVIYQPGNPKHHKLLLTPNDFETYKIPFPDSLDWVVMYIH